MVEPTQDKVNPDMFNMENDDPWPEYTGPKRSAQEIEADVQYFINHPLNSKQITPEQLDMPEYKALQDLAYEGDPDEIALNFKNHGYKALGKLLLQESKNQDKDVQEAIYCFDQGIDSKSTNKETNFLLHMGRAKSNILLANFGKTKDDCLEALKYKKADQTYVVLVRSRIFVERYEEAIKYAKEGLALFKDHARIKELQLQAENEIKSEKQRISQISTIQNIENDKKYILYKLMREKKIKIGKKVHHLPEMVDCSIHIDEEGKLVFPVLILYDEYMTSDFLQFFKEDYTLRDMLEQVFEEPLPWDQERKYSLKSIEVYFEADGTQPLDPKDRARDKSGKKYIECSLDETLLEILQHKYHIVPQYPVLKIVCKNSAYRQSFLNEI